MSKNQSLNKKALAAQYSVSVSTLNKWLSASKALTAVLAPYKKARARILPPDVVNKIYEVLGEP